MRSCDEKVVEGAKPQGSTPADNATSTSTTVVHKKSIFDLKLQRSPSSMVRIPITVKEYEVTDADMKSFQEHGYFMPATPMLSKACCAQLRKDYARLFEGTNDTDATPPEFEFWAKVVADHKRGDLGVRKVNNAWWINHGQRELISSESIGKVAGRLLQCDEIRLWHDQAIWKPGVGDATDDESLAAGNIGWHQDYGFWRASSSPQMITAFVALQDIDLKNGGLRTILGSHHWGLIKDSNAFFDKDLAGQCKRFAESAPAGCAWDDVPTIMKEGQIAFHHSLTFHGSGANRTSAPRLAAAVHMQGSQVRFKQGFWHSNVRELGPHARDGDRFDGPCFPLMWRAPAPERAVAAEYNR